MEAADQRAAALVFQVLEDRPRGLPHQNRVRWVVVNAKLIAHAMLVANSGQPPRAGRALCRTACAGPEYSRQDRAWLPAERRTRMDGAQPKAGCNPLQVRAQNRATLQWRDRDPCPEPRAASTPGAPRSAR